MNVIRCIVIIISACCFMSCSVIAPVDIKPTNKYTLDQLPPIYKSSRHSYILLITLPETQTIYNTTQIVYSSKPHQIAFFGKNEWAETPSQMLQNLLVQTFARTQRFKLVFASPQTGLYDFMLNTQIIKLQQNYSVKPAFIDLLVSVQLIKANSYKIIATKDLHLTQPILGDKPYDGIIASNILIARLLAEIQSLVLTAI